MSTSINPDALLEQLIEGALREIGIHSITGFEHAIDSAIDYHRFLMIAYRTEDETLGVSSLATLSSYFLSVHQEWTNLYRPILKRAAERAIEDPGYFSHVAYIHIRLLPRNANQYSDDVLIGLLRLPWSALSELLHYTRRRRALQGLLSDHDTDLYRSALSSFVSSWERTLDYADYIYDWSAPTVTEQEAWAKYYSSLPYLLTHLVYTTQFSLAAVRHRDRSAVELLSDMLARWYSKLENDFDNAYIVRSEFIRLEQMQAEFSNVQALAEDIRFYGKSESAAPSQLFGVVIRNTWLELLLVTTSIAVSWPDDESHCATQAVRIMLGIEAVEHDVRYSRFPSPKFRELFFAHIRCILRWGHTRKSYVSRVIQDAVTQLDGMRSSAKIAGRIYSDDIKTTYGELLRYSEVILISFASQAELHGTLRFISDSIAEFDDPGDVNIRALISYLRDLDSVMERLSTSESVEVLSQIAPSLDVDRSSLAFKTFLHQFRVLLKKRHKRNIDASIIDRNIPDKIERQIKSGLLKGAPFPSFIPNAHRIKLERLPSIELYLGRPTEKAYLTSPPLADIPVNFVELTQSMAWDLLSRAFWGQFHQIVPEDVYASSEEAFSAQLNLVSEELRRADKEPIILMPSPTSIPYVQKSVVIRGDTGGFVQFEHKDIKAWEYYITANSVDVYLASGLEYPIVCASDIVEQVVLSSSNEKFVSTEYIGHPNSVCGTLYLRLPAPQVEFKQGSRVYRLNFGSGDRQVDEGEV